MTEHLSDLTTAEQIGGVLAAPRVSWKAHTLDLLERASATFLAGFLGVVLATSAKDTTALKAGAVAGAVSVAKWAYIRLNAYNRNN